MIEDILEEAVPKNYLKKIQSETNGKTKLSSDKELLEEFFNSMDLDSNNTTNIESVSPELRLDKYLWVIRQKEIELNKCKIIAEESINRTQGWFEKKEQSINSTIEFLTNQMRNYLNQNSLKKLSLPNGNIGYRKQPDLLIVEDEKLFLDNSKPELLKHIEEAYEPDIKAIKEYIKQSGGDIPKGIDVKTQDPKFYYKLSEV